MFLRNPSCSVSKIPHMLASALGIESEGSVHASTMDVCREFAFSSEDADEFRSWYLASECFSKFLDGEPSNEARREEVAMEKFHAAEDQCRLANERLTGWESRVSLRGDLIHRARCIIARVLGPFDIERFPYVCGFGPGASSSLARKRASHQNKWVLSTHVTEGALPYLHAFKRWCGDLPLPDKEVVVVGNRVTTVPKSFKTDRIIAIEPDWNAFFQHGVGALIRQRLRKVGLLHPDAQDTNRALARLGSWTGSLATLDMSSASDTVSLALCEALLPPAWFKVIMDLRSEQGVTPDGKVVTYEKVSSMGNGFTFELETLIFYALTLAVCGNGNRERIAVYGDDIICPSECAHGVIDLLIACGFSVNSGKSFWDGPFRESCGGHFWQGRDVTPFYLRHPLETVSDVIVLANSLTQWAGVSSGWYTFSDVYRVLRSAVPKTLRGPYGADGCLWDEWDRCTPVWSRRFQSYRQKVVARSHRYTDATEHTGAYLHKLWTESPEVVGSRIPRALRRERVVTRYFCRDQWSVLPVRLA